MKEETQELPVLANISSELYLL